MGADLVIGSTKAQRLFAKRRPADQVFPFRGTARIDETVLRLADGRRVGLARGGPAAVEPVLYIHGILGSRLEAFIGGEPRHRVIAIDRPGYGLSDPLPQPSFSQFGRDVEAVLDQLGIQHCTIFGGSAGSPYALAAAVGLGERVRRLFLVAGVAHATMVRSAGVPMRWLVDFAENAVLRERVVPGLRELLGRPLVANGWLRMSLATEAELLPSAAAAQLLAKRLSASWVAGSAGGAAGVKGDLAMLTTPWDFDHTGLLAPVLVVHGGKDGVVPLDHARWHVRHLPGARLKILPRHRHVTTILATSHKVIAWAARRERRRPAG